MRSASAEQLSFYSNVSHRAGEARSKLPFEVSDHLAQHLTLVSDPNDLLSQVELERKRRFHLLIQRYINQIQYGCKNPSCTTPTCFSCRKRLAASPVRKYTPLSARTLACFLADARNPEAALCPYEPVHSVELHSPFSEDKSHHLSSRRASAGSRLANGHTAQKHTDGKLPTALPALQASSNQAAAHGNEEVNPTQTPTFVGRTRPKILLRPTRDPKSFTQGLFDALPLKLLEWIPHTPQPSTSQGHHHNSRQVSYAASLNQHQITAHQQPITHHYGHKPHAAGCNDEDAYRETTTTHLNGSAIANGHVKEHTTLRTLRASPMEAALHNGGFERSTNSLQTSGGARHEVPADDSSLRRLESSESSYVSGDSCPHPQQSSDSGPKGDKSSSVPSLTSLTTEVLKELDILCREARNEQLKSELLDFIRQSLYYCLKDPYRIPTSFETSHSSNLDSGTPSSSGNGDRPVRLNPLSVRTNLRTMFALGSWREIIRNISIATHGLYIPASLRRLPLPTFLLNERQATLVCVIGLYALTELAKTTTNLPDDDLAGPFDHLRAARRIPLFPEQYLDPFCLFDDFESLNLLEKIVNVTVNRWTIWEISKTHNNPEPGDSNTKPPNMIQSILDYMEHDTNEMLKTWASMKTAREKIRPDDAMLDIPENGLLSMLTLCWLRALMLREWDGRTSVRKSDTVGNVLQILAAMYERHGSIGLKPADFWSKSLVKRFDPFDMPMEWLAFRSDNRTVHLLSYSFLFPPEILVTYFRATNYSRMVKTTEGVTLTKRTYNEFVASPRSYEIPANGGEALEQRLRIIGLPRFVIEVRRDHVLTDAINQIWRRQKCELLKPLKVRMGADEGEEGVDSGGVQQEFFRVLFAEALNPCYGMFTIDEDTRMTWFQPESLEPIFKFEALGILMSLAVYNSITLPITFPIAFYRKLLGLKVKKLAHITDGWPLLAKNLQGLLNWKDGDVGDVLLRTYEFSYEAFGQVASVDMSRYKRDIPWPPQRTREGKVKMKTASFDMPPMSTVERHSSYILTSASHAEDTPTEAGYHGGPMEASLVTNANREQYVKDYVFWLTDKSVRPQYEAFARGFYTCLDRTALSVFTAEALQSFIEGVQEIDMDSLQASTVYDGYTADDQVVKWFWEVVKLWDHNKKKLLLEFITASDRVPVNGVSVIGLVIQCAGRSDEILPRSMTCFATFLLPLYSSKEVLERMLGIAIEHAKGFGTI